MQVDVISGTAPSRGLILGVLCTAAFAFPLSAFIVSPLLVDLSQAFGVTVTQAGQLVTLAAIPSAALSLLVGPISDHYGRRPILLLGTIMMGVSSLGSALAPTYELMAASRILTGIGSAMVGPAVFAAVADIVPYHERGKAYGTLLAAMNLSTILGMPAVTLIAATWGWRWAFGAVGVVMIVAFAAAWLLFPARSAAAGSSIRQAFVDGYVPVIRDAGARAVLVSTLAMSIGWMAFQTYFGAFFIFQYGISTGDLAPILALSGIGVLIGSQIGGRVGDRLGHKPITIWAIALATVFILLLLGVKTSVEVAALINFVLSIPMGMRFTSMSVLISEAAPTARGTMNSLNATFFNSGIFLGSFVGGIVIDSIGFIGLGGLVLAGHVISLVILSIFVQEQRALTPPSQVDGVPVAPATGDSVTK